MSLRKEAQTYFDLTASGNNQIVALVNADLNLDPNALIMSLTMEDGSIWQQGKRLDVVGESGSLTNYADDGSRFAIQVSPGPKREGLDDGSLGTDRQIRPQPDQSVGVILQ